MKKIVTGLLFGIASLSAGAACTDGDLTPDLYGSIAKNDSMGSLYAKFPCGVPTPSTYKDGIGREFSVYTWATLNKSITVETYEGRVFNKTGNNTGFQATKVAPPAASFDSTSNVMSMPVLTVTDSSGVQRTYYDAKVSLTENGGWAVLGMDDSQKGSTVYDTRGYAAANYDLRTGALTVPTVSSNSVATPFAFRAVLASDGTWRDTSDAADLGKVESTPSNALVASAVFSQDWPGFAPNGIVVVNNVAYRNVDSSCTIPAWQDSIVTVDAPGGTGPEPYQTINKNPTLSIFRSGVDTYLTVSGWNSSCKVHSEGTATPPVALP